jgi:BirA family biotin operon repressor/biotin-[acetyl-CoA-carboxylase] ligase
LTGAPAVERTGIVRLGDVGSTNDEAIERLRGGSGAVWVVAERQLSGRGRRGRSWVSEKGNLYASHAFTSGLEADAFGLLPLAVANALADAIEAAAGVETRLKWPNDVLVGGLKVSGILIETEFTGAVRRVVIGCGVNVAHHPDGLPATHLAAVAPGVRVEAVFDALVPALGAALARLGATDGIAATRARWLERAVGVGGPVTVRFEGEARDGEFVGLDAAGRLVLRDAAGRESLVAAGDVFIREHL